MCTPSPAPEQHAIQLLDPSRVCEIHPFPGNARAVQWSGQDATKLYLLRHGDDLVDGSRSAHGAVEERSRHSPRRHFENVKKRVEEEMFLLANYGGLDEWRHRLKRRDREPMASAPGRQEARRGSRRLKAGTASSPLGRPDTKANGIVEGSRLEP